METATLFDIQRMSLHDGPGIRTTVFFKGCGLRCFWCHNPESLSVKPQLLFYPDRCIQCRICAQVCPRGCHQFEDQETGLTGRLEADDRGLAGHFETDDRGLAGRPKSAEKTGTAASHIFSREACIICGSCAKSCPAGALQVSGYQASLEDVLKQVTRDIPFYKSSGGGVTASGGEPLLQAPFVAALFRSLKERGVHTAVETALFVPPEALEQILPYTDLVIADMKHPDPQMHQEFTGQDNRLILENFTRLEASSVPYMIRIPVIPGVNDSVATMRRFEANMLPLKRRQCVELMPWHDFGLGKYAGLNLDAGRQDGLKPPSREKLMELGKAFTQTSVIFRDGSETVHIRTPQPHHTS